MTHYTGVLFAFMAVTLLALATFDRGAAMVAMTPVSCVYVVGVAAIHKNKVSNRV